MPEIAEVRVVAKVLKKNLLGQKINKIKIPYPKIVESDNKEFVDTLENLTFTSIKSYGKYLIFELGKYSFISHLRMEGKYFYVDTSTPVDKHTHLIFTLKNGYDLRYNDVRKFGRIKLVKTEQVFEDPALKKLGIEPDNKSLTKEYLLEKLQNKKIPIKSLLLDQTIINGLGNIYANEVLFASRIHPLKLGNSITEKEASAIIKNADEIITKSFECGGCTIRSYTSSLGVTGHYQDYLKVQSKESSPCPNCSTPIKRIKIEGRSAFFCEKCQKL